MRRASLRVPVAAAAWLAAGAVVVSLGAAPTPKPKPAGAPASSPGAPADDPAAHFKIETLAEGVHAVIRQDLPGMMVDANNVLIVGDEDVIVVDSNGAPAITRAVLAVLRKITPKPVRYVVHTHYHDDHIRGDAVYRQAFPGVDFIGHPFTRSYLPEQGAANRKGFLEGAPGFLQELERLVAAGKSLTGGPLTDEERRSLESDIRLAGFVLKDGAAAEAILPTITVADRLVLHRGDRTVEVLHLGSGHTAADLVVHLPKEGIVVAGDLVAWPVPLVGNPQSHVADWAETLKRLRALAPKIIVPGHGPVLRDEAYVAAVQEMFASIATQAGAAAARGDTLEQARRAVDLARFRDSLAGESPVRRILFATYVAGPAVEAAYAEARQAPPAQAPPR